MDDKWSFPGRSERDAQWSERIEAKLTDHTKPGTRHSICNYQLHSKGRNSSFLCLLVKSQLRLISARIPKEYRRYCFHRCLSVYISPSGWQGRGTWSSQWRVANWGGGYSPCSGLVGDTQPSPVQDWMGVPLPSRNEWSTLSPIRRQSIIASTCYVACGMPLAFTQDFLVSYWLL